jgi:hypothetical protein
MKYQKFAVFGLSLLLIVLHTNSYLVAGEKLFIEMKDFSRTELKAGGFTLPNETSLHIKTFGAGAGKGKTYNSDRMFAYGWIINSDTREKVWLMSPNNTSLSKDERKFDDYIKLPKGSYEIYFSACFFEYHSTWTHITTNIDHRNGEGLISIGGKNNLFFNWLEDWFGDDIYKDFDKRAKKWGIELYVDQNIDVSLFNPPKEFPNVLYKAVNLGENEYLKQGFVLSKPLAIHIYALGEMNSEDEPSDYGYILDTKTHTRIWEMTRRNVTKAGGADKNTKFDRSVNFDAGKYVIYYQTDDSHSSVDWNEAPPYDPLNYGVTLSAFDEKDKKAFQLYTPKEDENVIVSISKVGDGETRSEGFTLKKDATVRVYAIGERYNSQRKMADYGWIVNAKTRNKVWEMNVDDSKYAGGGSKNRMVDEIVHLKKGSYIVYFQTDDSHSYDDWNDDPPHDPEHWGITVYGADEGFDMSSVEKYKEERDQNIVAQIIRVRDNANQSEIFKLSEPTRVRIYAIGEGQRDNMVDYGWIENTFGKVIWEMTYSMTFHAGGARKNRIVNTTILLDKGEYRLHYKSDDSHSYGDWNDDAPEDPQYWGITLYRDTDNNHK